jgi:hypothetical protein
MSLRLRTLLAVSGLAAALAVVIAPPTVAAATQAQTVAFTSIPPEDADWFTGDKFGIGYVAQASASSGLPVTFSVSPASAGVCSLSDFWAPEPTRAAIRFLGPGTCTIHADQPGTEEYLPADQASQSFVIDKVQPSLSGLRQKSTTGRTRTFRALLMAPTMLSSFYWGMWGLPDQLVTFSVGGKPVCSGTTNGQGVATCSATLGLADWMRVRFTASYAGDAMYHPVARNGPTYGDRLLPSEPPF